MTTTTKGSKAILLASAAATLGLLNAAYAQSAVETQVCSRGGDIRSIEVLKPGDVGAACDLRYTRDGGADVRTPYHANSSEDFCAQKAVELTQSLVSAGFECVAGDADQIFTAAAPQPAEQAAPAAVAPTPTQTADAGAPVAADEPDDAPSAPVSASDPAPQSVVSEPAGPAQTVASAGEPDPAPSALPVSSPEAVSTAQAGAPQSVQVPEAPSAEPVSTRPASTPQPQRQALNVPEAPAPTETADAPAPTEAVRGPQSLTQATSPALASNEIRRSGSAAGRIVGAEPQEPARIETAQVAAEDRLSAPETAAQPVQQAALDSAPTPQPRNVQKLRPAPDIIRGVLNAQAAAWNDGDLEGFMAGYWKSPDLRFVSGTDVTTGWSQTMKRYKSEYGDGASLGILTFDNLDVEMVSDDVAVVVGEFNLTRGPNAEDGKFSLVMKQFDGRWRIVHDHTVSNDPTR